MRITCITEWKEVKTCHTFTLGRLKGSEWSCRFHHHEQRRLVSDHHRGPWPTHQLTVPLTGSCVLALPPSLLTGAPLTYLLLLITVELYLMMMVLHHFISAPHHQIWQVNEPNECKIQPLVQKISVRIKAERLHYKKMTMQRICIKDLFNPCNHMQPAVFLWITSEARGCGQDVKPWCRLQKMARAEEPGRGNVAFTRCSQFGIISS